MFTYLSSFLSTKAAEADLRHARSITKRTMVLSNILLTEASNSESHALSIPGGIDMQSSQVLRFLLRCLLGWSKNLATCISLSGGCTTEKTITKEHFSAILQADRY